MYYVWCRSTIGDVPLDDRAWLSLLAKYRYSVVCNDERIQSIYLGHVRSPDFKFKTSLTPSQGAAAACASLPKNSTLKPA